MTQRISPFIEAKYGWNVGEGGWNTGMDENLLKFSFLLDRNIEEIVDTLPAGTSGKAYYLTTDNRVYFNVGGTYYSTPVPKWFILTEKVSGTTWQFTGIALEEVKDSADALRQELDDDLVEGGGAMLVKGAMLQASTIADIRLLEPISDRQQASVAGYYTSLGGGGIFEARFGNYSAEVLSDPLNGIYVPFPSDPTGLSGAWVRIFSDAADVRWWGAKLDGVHDDAPALQAACALCSSVTVRDGTLRAGALVPIRNNSIKFENAGCVVDADTLFQVSSSCEFISIEGCMSTSFTGVAGSVLKRFLTCNVNSVDRVSIINNNVGLGRVSVELLAPSNPSVLIEGNVWVSSSTAYLGFSSLLVALGTLDATRDKVRGAVIQRNKLNIYGPSGLNFDAVKVSADCFAARVVDNDVVNLNPTSGMEIDTYTGGNHAWVERNSLFNCCIKSQSNEQSAYGDGDQFVTIAHNKLVFSDDYVGGNLYGILRKGADFRVSNNDIVRTWPDGIVNSNWRAIWLNTTQNNHAYGTTPATRFDVSHNEVIVDYSNANGFTVIPVAFTSTSPAQQGVLIGNRMYGGASTLAPNFPANSTAIGNRWVPGPGSAGTVAAGVGSINVGNTWS